MPQENTLEGRAPDMVPDRTHIPLGIFSILLGLGVGWRAIDYGVGSFRDMGPGFFPLACAVLLLVLGTIVILRGGRDLPEDELLVPRLSAEARRAHVLRVSRVLGATLGGLAIFALILQPAGMVVSVIALVCIVSLAHPGPRLLPVLALAVGLSIFSALVFVVALRVQVSIWPEVF